MAKNVFFSKEVIAGVEQLVQTEHGRTVIDYGKGNFLLGVGTTVTFGLFGYGFYQAIKLGSVVVNYLKS